MQGLIFNLISSQTHNPTQNQCTNGYTGDLCNAAPDVCSDINCQNDGECDESGLCQCPVEFTGALCVDKSACHPDETECNLDNGACSLEGDTVVCTVSRRGAHYCHGCNFLV